MDNVVSQQIPHDSEAEKAVLGAVFLDPEAIIDASDVLQPDDFYEHANRIVFQAMLNISDREEVIDPVTLQDELKKKRKKWYGLIAIVSLVILAILYVLLNNSITGDSVEDIVSNSALIVIVGLIVAVFNQIIEFVKSRL